MNPPTLEQAFGTLHEVLRGAADPAVAHRRLGLDPARVAFYQETVFEHVRDVLDKNYGVLAAVLGPERFDALVAEYFAEVPATAFELNENAAPFREFLAVRAEVGTYGLTEAHLELAELEWQEFAVYVSEATIPEPSAISAPQINPTLTILQLDYPVADFLDAWREAGDSGSRPHLPADPAPQLVFVLRHPETDNALFFEATDALLFAFKVSHDGLSVQEAAEQAGVADSLVLAALQDAANWGLVILPAGWETQTVDRRVVEPASPTSNLIDPNPVHSKQSHGDPKVPS